MQEVIRGYTGQFPIFNAGERATSEYNEGKKIRIKKPEIRLLISPHIPKLGPVELVAQDTSGIIQSIRWVKSRSSAYGELSVTFAANDRALQTAMEGQPAAQLSREIGASMWDIFQPMTLCLCYIDGYHLATCYLASFRKSTSASSKTYTANFKELGAMYDQNVMDIGAIVKGPMRNFQGNPNSVLDVLSTGIQGNEKAVNLASDINFYANAFISSTLAYTKSIIPYQVCSDGLPMATRLIAAPPPYGAISPLSIIGGLSSSSNLMSLASGSSFWSFLKSCASEPMMELFTESGGRTIGVGRAVPIGTGLRSSFSSTVLQTSLGAKAAIPLPAPGLNLAVLLPGLNYIVARTAPYEIPWLGVSSWFPVVYPYLMGYHDLLMAGDFIIVTDDDIISRDIGWDEANQFTLFEVSMRSGDGVGGVATVSRPSVAGGPIIPFMPGGIKSYGWRHKGITVGQSANTIEAQGNSSIEKFSKRYGDGVGLSAIPLSTVANEWFRNAAKFKEGTFTTRAIPYARPGMLLLYLPSSSGSRMDDQREFGAYYIDNISYNYEIGQADTTSFSVIRGVPMPFDPTGTMDTSPLLQLLLFYEITPPGLNLSDLL